MTSPRWLAISGCAALSTTLVGCGSRSDLAAWDTGPEGTGGGGGGASSSSTTVTESTTTTSPLSCDGLVVAGPTVLLPNVGFARRPAVEVLPSGDALFGWILAAPNVAGPLFEATGSAFGPWPPEISAPVPAGAQVMDFDMGPGPDGPVGLVLRASDGAAIDEATLATSMYPEIADAGVPITPNRRVLFVAAVPERYFWGQVYPTPEYDVMQIGSYQPGSLPQTEGPFVCIDGRPRAAAAPSGSGFLAAYLEPSPPEPSCPMAPTPGSVVSISRYEAPPEPGSQLQRTQGERFSLSEPVVQLDLASTPAGAWVVYQSDGSTAEEAPPVMAARLDASGKAQSMPFAVTPSGVLWPAVAAVAIGEALLVVWVDPVDPSAPTLIAQVVSPNGTLGAAVSVPTNDAWYAGGLDIVASPSGNSALLTWEAGFGEGRIATARIDCVTAL